MRKVEGSSPPVSTTRLPDFIREFYTYGGPITESVTDERGIPVQLIKRLLRCVPVLLFANMIWLFHSIGFRSVFVLLAAAVLEVLPYPHDRWATRRLRILHSGCEMLYVFAFSFLVECGIWIHIFAVKSLIFWLNLLCSLLVLFAVLLSGMLCIFFCSKQAGILRRVLLLIFWWLPGVNFYLIVQIGAAARREYRFELACLERDEIRKSSELCNTRYPILLVHGIFFRDWQLLDYWGRITSELKKNGARVYFGKQQSADAVARSAEELCQQILRVIELENCEKVNIIAHSKGGLDSRYAIAHYGMDQYVASLTTVNTPHRGCNFVDLLLRVLPEGVIGFLAGRYNALFRKLGDIDPDFEKGVRDLTAARCAEFNRETPDSPGVYYQSVMSRLRSARSAIFPMNLCYLLIRRLDGDNDGLVAVDSAVWGDYRGLIETPYRKGVSHGDVVDLLRENLKGFDVREYYVQLVHDLKKRGF